jgi:dTMP kinase
MIRGKLIVLEGIDGSGTTTQAAMLKKEFVERGLPAHVTAEPSNGPVGSLIRQALSGRLVVRGRRSVRPPDWTTMALLFAADRQDHVASEIGPNLIDGVNVICDRYIYSSIVYQSVSAGKKEAVDWICELNRYTQKPDLVLYLKIDPAEARRRREGRDFRSEIYDEPEFQEKLAKTYDTLPDLFPDTNLVTVEAGRAVGEVTAECWTQIEHIRSSGRCK